MGTLAATCGRFRKSVVTAAAISSSRAGERMAVIFSRGISGFSAWRPACRVGRVRRPSGRALRRGPDRGEPLVRVLGIKIDEVVGVRLTVIEGDVGVGGLGGPAEVGTARGGVRIPAVVRGKVVLRTQSGDISAGAAVGVSAALDADLGCGRVGNVLETDGVAGLDIRVTASHGDITVCGLWGSGTRSARLGPERISRP